MPQYTKILRMTNTFLKRRGGGGGDGCWRREGSGPWTFSPDFCWASGVRITQVGYTPWFSLGYIHARTYTHTGMHVHMYTHVHTHTPTRVHTYTHTHTRLMHWFDGVCDVSAGLHRGQSCHRGLLQPHLYCLYTMNTQPLSGLQLLRL